MSGDMDLVLVGTRTDHRPGTAVLITWTFQHESVARPLAGHRGDCAKVTHATISGETDWPCTCDTGDRA